MSEISELNPTLNPIAGDESLGLAVGYDIFD
jgi:hypothetical protein